MAALIFWLPLLVPIALAGVTRINLLAIWNMESLGLLPVVLMSSPLISVGRVVAARIVALAITVSVLALLASPIVAAVKIVTGVENDATYAPAAVAAVQREWSAETDRSLEILAGPFGLTSSMAFSLKDRPLTFADFSFYLSPWLDNEALMHKGLAVICPRRNRGCMASLNRLLEWRPAARQVEVELTPHWLGLSGAADRFVIAILPPRSRKPHVNLGH
jgi:hypothetical protein